MSENRRARDSIYLHSRCFDKKPFTYNSVHNTAILQYPSNHTAVLLSAGNRCDNNFRIMIIHLNPGSSICNLDVKHGWRVLSASPNAWTEMNIMKTQIWLFRLKCPILFFN